MGYLSKGVCHPTIESARSDLCASAVEHWGDGANFRNSQCVSSDFTSFDSYVVGTHVNGGPATYIAIPYPPFPPCDFATAVENTTELFGLGLTAIVLVVLAKWVYSFFAPNRRSDDPL